MKKKIRQRRLIFTLGFVAALAIVASALSWPGATPARAQSMSAEKEKVSADLKQKLSGGNKLNILIKAAASWETTLDNAVKANGGAITKSYANFNVRAASLPASAVSALAGRSDVEYVSLDREVKLLGHVSLTSGADAASVMANYNPTYDGAGVGIAVLDSGLDPNHVSLTAESGSTTRIAYSKDFTGEGTSADPYGHGTHVASIAAGNGQVSNGAYRGIAPGAKIVNLRVLNSQGKGTVSTLLSALDWIKTNRTTYNIRVVNLSLGTAAVDSYRTDPLCLAVRGLVDAGVVVVAAAGNEGRDGQGTKIYGQIHSPGIDPSVITVGAANTFGTDARNDDGVTTYSSRGPTRSFWTDSFGAKHYDNLVKPDLVAPGNKIIDAQAGGGGRGGAHASGQSEVDAQSRQGAADVFGAAARGLQHAGTGRGRGQHRGRDAAGKACPHRPDFEHRGRLAAARLGGSDPADDNRGLSVRLVAGHRHGSNVRHGPQPRYQVSGRLRPRRAARRRHAGVEGQFDKRRDDAERRRAAQRQPYHL
jgi:subtilisin family serine protease